MGQWDCYCRLEKGSYSQARQKRRSQSVENGGGSLCCLLLQKCLSKEYQMVVMKSNRETRWFLGRKGPDRADIRPRGHCGARN